jgi:hypothetical protein
MVLTYFTHTLITVKSLISVWVLFSRGCHDRENKTHEYESI